MSRNDIIQEAQVALLGTLDHVVEGGDNCRSDKCPLCRAYLALEKLKTDEKKPARGEHMLVNWDLGPVLLTVWYDQPRKEIEAVFFAGLTDIYDCLSDEQVEAIRKIVMDDNSTKGP